MIFAWTKVGFFSRKFYIFDMKSYPFYYDINGYRLLLSSNDSHAKFCDGLEIMTYNDDGTLTSAVDLFFSRVSIIAPIIINLDSSPIERMGNRFEGGPTRQLSIMSWRHLEPKQVSILYDFNFL